MASEEFTAAGSDTWTAPAGVTEATVECWGGGGGAGGTTGLGSPYNGGGGGGGGAYSLKVVTVTPGNTYNLVVGSGGSGGSGTDGSAGGDSTFDSTVVVAKGGSGGGGAGGSGGSGGSAASGTGDTKYSGGDGGNGGSDQFGAGGSSAGTAANGNNGATGASPSTTTAPSGGGDGGGLEASGSQPGGGGGASGTSDGNTGGVGKVVVTWTASSPIAQTLPSLTQSASSASDAASTLPAVSQSAQQGDVAVTILPALGQVAQYEAAPAALSRTQTLATTLHYLYEWQLTVDLGLSIPTDQRRIQRTSVFTNGNEDDESNQIYYEQFTLTDGETREIDLVGQLYNPLGELVSFAKIKRLLIVNEGIEVEGSFPAEYTTSLGEDILVGGGGASGKAWGYILDQDQDATIKVRSGGTFLWMDPVGASVVAGSIERLLFTGLGEGPNTISVFIEGVQ